MADTNRYRSTANQNGSQPASRSATSGRFVSQGERVAAARARVTADKKRGVDTAAWIQELAATKTA